MEQNNNIVGKEERDFNCSDCGQGFNSLEALGWHKSGGCDFGLLPCPFCGGKATMNQFHKYGYEIKCGNCAIRYKQKVLYKSLDWLKETMIKNWNKRIVQPLSPQSSVGVEEKPSIEQLQYWVSAYKETEALLNERNDELTQLQSTNEELIKEISDRNEYYESKIEMLTRINNELSSTNEAKEKQLDYWKQRCDEFIQLRRFFIKGSPLSEMMDKIIENIEQLKNQNTGQ